MACAKFDKIQLEAAIIKRTYIILQYKEVPLLCYPKMNTHPKVAPLALCWSKYHSDISNHNIASETIAIFG